MGGGIRAWLNWNKRLFFSDLEEALPATTVVWITGAMGCLYAPFVIWNSFWRDPEVTWRPHRRGFANEERIPRATYYKNGSFRFLFPHWVRYQDQCRNLLWEELMIPKDSKN